MQEKIIKILAILPFILAFSYLVYLPLGEGSLNLQDIFLIAFVLTSAVWVKRKLNSNKIKILLKNSLPVLLLLFLLNLSILFSFLANASNGLISSLGYYKSLFLLPILFALLLKILKKEKIINGQTVFKGYFLYGCFLSFWGIGYLFIGRITFDGRLKIFFQSPNQLAMSLAIGIIIGVFLIKNKLKNQQARSAFLLAALTSIQAICLFYTQSIGAMGGLAGALVLVIIYESKANWKKIYYALLIILSLGSLFFLLFHPQMEYGYPAHKNKLPDSIDSRKAIYQAAAEINRDYFPFGVGLGNFQEKYLAYQEKFPPYPQWAVPHAHNFWLYLSVEIGILGLLSLAVLVFLKLYQFLIKKNPENMLRAALLAYFIIHSLADVPFVKNDLALIFWTILLL